MNKNIPAPSWKKFPDHYGWWYVASSEKDWDIGDMYAVERREYGDGKIEYFVILINSCELNVRSVKFEKCVWYGPFIVQKPTGNIS